MSNPRHNQRDVYPPTGDQITAKSWLTEAPMRMLMNNLHPDVAESPHELVVYGGMGRAARTWDDFDRIVSALAQFAKDRDRAPDGANQQGFPIRLPGVNGVGERRVLGASFGESPRNDPSTRRRTPWSNV